MKLKLSCLVIIIEIVWGGVGEDGEAYSPKNRVSTVKFGGGSIMIWGCFSEKVVGKISVIDGKINAQKYKKILQENLMSLLSFEQRYIFQQDNDPKYTAKSTKKWSSKNNVNVLQWPSRSPGLNSTGN